MAADSKLFRYMVMAYIAMTYIAMAYIVMAADSKLFRYIVMADLVMTYIAMAYIVMAADSTLFSVRHFGGVLDYDGSTFAEANRRRLPIDIKAVLRSSSSEWVAARGGLTEPPSAVAEASAAAAKICSAMQHGQVANIWCVLSIFDKISAHADGERGSIFNISAHAEGLDQSGGWHWNGLGGLG